MNQSAGFRILTGYCLWYFNHVLVSLFSLFANTARLFLQQTMNLPFDGQPWRLAVIIDDFVQCEFQLFHMHFAVICDNRLNEIKIKTKTKMTHFIAGKGDSCENGMSSIKLISDTCQDSMM